MKIFISIASYKDPILLFTLKDCVAKADRPENLVFGVVDQHDGDQRAAMQELPFSDQIRYVYVHSLDTLGVSWARNIAFSLYNGEDFLLQIDSHMLFEPGWDTTLIRQFEVLQETSPKPVISTYPYSFEFDENDEPVYKKPTGKTVLVLRPHPETSLNEDNAVLRFRAEHVENKGAVVGCHLAAGFIFTKGEFVEEVPYDPYLYFHGEEQSLAVRAFTRGWDIYHPEWIPLYHLYKQANTEHDTHHWHKSVEKKRSIDYATLRERAYKRVYRLLCGDGLPGSAYGLGQMRTLEEFKAISGIDYRNKIIASLA